ncbi:MAG: WbqC family protein [Vulcanimicrobiota bacterium]
MISIHQSQFLPWLPYFFKMHKCSLFVILDDVQFQKNGLQNRNKIKTPNGMQWLTIAVRFNFGDPINMVQIADKKIYKRLLRTIELNYRKSRYFSEIYEWLEEVLSKEIQNLNELNMILLDGILKKTGMNKKIVFSSQMELTSKKNELIIEIMKKLNAKDYLSGKGALGYMDLEKFRASGLNVYSFDFTYTEYPQLWNNLQGFIPDLSIIDILFNNLEKTLEYVSQNGKLIKICEART